MTEEDIAGVESEAELDLVKQISRLEAISMTLDQSSEAFQTLVSVIDDLKAMSTSPGNAVALAHQALEEEGSWPKEVKKGRFTNWCKGRGFKDGASISCAKEALASDDSSVRGMATFYKNTVKPNGQDAGDI